MLTSLIVGGKFVCFVPILCASVIVNCGECQC